MTKHKNQPLIPPYTSNDFLDYVMQFEGEQVDAYKKLCSGIARSSYTIQYCPEDETFEMYAGIIGEFETLTRSAFIALHGNDAHIWHIHPTPAPKPENENSTLIALCEESPDVPPELRSALSGNRNKSRCARCSKLFPCPENPAEIVPLCDRCCSEYGEGSAYYGVLFGCKGSDTLTSAGNRNTLAEAMKYVGYLDRLGYDCRLYKGKKSQNDAQELRLWIPILRIFPEQTEANHEPADTTD